MDDTEAALAPLRTLGDPVVDLLAERPYIQQQSYLDATEPKGDHYYWKTEFAAELSGDLLSTVRDLAAENPIPDGQLVIAHIGGALNERDDDDGAVNNRDARFAYGAAGRWDPDDPNGGAYREWVRTAWDQLRPYSTGGNYINFQTADEDEERIRATYGDNFARLVEIKAQYDPENVFRVNRNIRPNE
ncbi:BBE domain-containing protein [Haloarcula nitratireducens]|uniref:BBE domain-containing protein n=1 Tax=Haloarcula nitratireducens TaxID=2487749 RepID=A0AAW4PJG8_9EURY|nr:BBE domain-containing protein [Halomicroarcula nitratireducens]MBX0297854.1 BBE domain-containing protein [Halomicroarcula nitratireducens]